MVDYKWEEFRRSSNRTDDLRPGELDQLIDLALDTKDKSWFISLMKKKEMYVEEMKLYPTYYNASRQTLMFYCYGCDRIHEISLAFWHWNHSISEPSLRPSVIVRHNPGEICESIIREGRIYYMKHCFHGLGGKDLKMRAMFERGDESVSN